MATPSRLQSLESLRVANLDAAFATAFVTLFGGSFFVGFVQHLGGGDLWVQLIAAVPAIMGLMQIPGAALGRASASFKNYIKKGGWAWRLFLGPIVLLPLLPIPNQAKLIALVACLGVAAFSVNLVNSTYNEWLGRIVPERSRGWYFSQRTLIATIVGMVIGMVGARLLDVFKGTPNEATGYTLIFAIGWAFGISSMFFFLRMSDTTREETTPVSTKEIINVIREPMRDKNFRQIMLFVAIFAVSQGFAGNLFAAFALESLKMPFTALQLTSVAAALGTVLTVRMWGFLADRYGSKPLLLLLSGGVMLTPLMWIACVPGQLAFNTTILFVGHIFTGIFWSGVGVVQLNLYLSTSTPQNRANYLAAALTVSSIALAVSPLAGSWMMSVLRGMMDPASAYKWVFAVVAFQRLIAVFCLIPVREKGSSSFGETMRQLSQIRPKSVVALRAIRKGAAEEEREGLIRSVGEQVMPLATNELADALMDPSPRIRREAAAALGRLGTPDAAEALVRLVKQNPELVEEETLEALGETRQPEAAQALIGFLRDPSAMLRRSAAKGLGKIADPTAIDPLREAVAQPGDPDLRRAALQALRVMGATDPDLYADALLDQHPSVRVAAAEAVAELQLSDLAENLRHSLDWFPDDGSSEVAYALGVVGTRDDLNLILESASRAVGMAKRRRCLLGAAHLLDFNRDLYRLFALEEVNRDTALLTKFRAAAKRDAALQASLDAYSTGEEPDALKHLATSGDPILQALATHAVPESYLLAVLVYGNQTASA